MSFSKTSNSTRSSDSCYFEVFEKLTRACYIQIALETMLLPILISPLNSVIKDYLNNMEQQNYSAVVASAVSPKDSNLK